MTEGLDRAERLKVGDEILVEDCLVSKGNLDISASRLLMRRKSNLLLGVVRKLECSGTEASGQAQETLTVDVEGRELVLDRANALKFLGLNVADDIALSTVAALKKSSLLNSRIAVRIANKDGRIQMA
jgi:hypothetical protein